MTRYSYKFTELIFKLFLILFEIKNNYIPVIIIMSITQKSSLIILDWDDTLFPTNWVVKNDINLATSNSRDQYLVYFQELDRILYKFLTKVLKLGKVIIVTNALPDWIALSSVVLPHTFKILQKIEVISARGLYRDKSQNTMDWKMMAFRDIIDREFQNPSLMNVISIGDAEYEYQALIALNDVKRKNKKYLKSVRFMKAPSHDILIDQLSVLKNAIPRIWDRECHLDLKLDFFSKIKR
jgi:hypothetical protein